MPWDVLPVAECEKTPQFWELSSSSCLLRSDFSQYETKITQQLSLVTDGTGAEPRSSVPRTLQPLPSFQHWKAL